MAKKSLTPAQRRATRAKYEAQAKARKDERLGLTKKSSKKKGRR